MARTMKRPTALGSADAVGSDELSPEIAELLSSAPRMVSADLMEKIRKTAAEVFLKRQEVAELEQRMAAAKMEIERLTRKTLPDLFDEAGVSSLTVKAGGNLPAMDVTLKPFYSASISAKWDPERRAEAYQWLDKNRHGSLIKTTVSVDFDRMERKKAQALVKELRRKKLPVEIVSNVHASTLTSWLKDQVERVKKVPPLDVIGGFIGREVKIKEKQS